MVAIRKKSALGILMKLAPCVLLLVFSHFVPPATARESFFDFQLDRALELRGLSIPLKDAEGGLIGIMSIDQVSVESAQIGFFKIGILPQLVLRGLRIAVEDSSECRWIDALKFFLNREPSLAGARIEGFEVATDNKLFFLEARSGEFSKDLEKVFLEKSLLRVHPHLKLRLNKAEICLSGEYAGLLRSIVPENRNFDLCKLLPDR